MKNIATSAILLLCISSIGFAQPSAPSTVAPATGYQAKSCSLLLDWTAVLGGVYYELQYDTSSTFSSPWMKTTNLTSAWVKDMYFNDRYYWRVRASNGTNFSSWSAVDTFYTMDASIHKSKSPKGGVTVNYTYLDGGKTQDVLYALSATLNWTYHQCLNSLVEVDTMTTFNSPGLKRYTTADSSLVISGFNYGTAYYWRFRQSNAVDTTVWQMTDTFMTIGKPVLFRPTDGQTNVGCANNAVDSALRLDVKPILGSVFYDLELDTSKNFNSPVKQTMLLDSTQTLLSEKVGSAYKDRRYKVFYPGAPLLFGQKYYWRSRAKTLFDVSNWSSVWSFVVEDSIDVVAPAQGSMQNTVTPTFGWVHLPGALGYYLQYDTSATFVQPWAANVAGGGDTIWYTPTSDLIRGETYYWRVQAYNSIDSSTWINRTFSVSPTAGVEEIITNTNLTVTPNPAQGRVMINIEGVNAIGSLEITDLNGRVVLSDQLGYIANIRKWYNVSNLNAGVYVVSLTYGDKLMTQKLVVE